jgi:bifunctional enzyme CysN/CysC
VTAPKGRERLNLVVAGHVDHGKSTIVGRLLVDTDSLPKGKLEMIKAYCERNAKPFEYAFLLDALKDEQAQGITIDAARIFFKTEKRDFLIIDAPGHIEFLQNMISGASHASAALLVIDAAEGVRENSRRHGYMLAMLGIRQIAVLVNKMDMVGYRQEVFDQVVEEYRHFLKEIDIEAREFLPVSGLQGENITVAPAAMPWFTGPTVLDVLDTFEPEGTLAGMPFRLPVQDVYKFTKMDDTRRIVAGTVDSGSIKVGDEVVFYPSGKSSTVETIEEFPTTTIDEPSAGQSAGFTLAQQIYVRRGELAALRSQPAPKVSTRLRTSLFWLGRTPLQQNKDYVLKLGTARTRARLTDITRILDASSLDTREGAGQIERHQVADCILTLDAPIACDLADENILTGRFVLLDDFEISGGGLVREAIEDPQAKVREQVMRRHTKWQRGRVSAQAREERYGQKATLLVITGSNDALRKEVSRDLEAELFEGGHHVYFLGIGSVLYGVDADIRGSHEDHAEDIRRLAEVSNILLDSGLILIVTASELMQHDLDIILTAMDREQVSAVWIGDEVTPPLSSDLHATGDDAADVRAQVMALLKNRGALE